MAYSSLHAPSRRPAPLVPVVLFLLGCLVAFLGSWNVSLWTDEAASVSAADRSIPELWRLIQGQDAVHAVYYLLLHGWTSVFGFSPVSLRLPSALAAGATVVGVWVLARILDRGDIAVVAATIAIVLPRVTWMGIEARSFGPSAAVAIWATVLLVASLRSGGWRWAVYSALVAVGIALNIYLALLVVAHAVTAISLRGISLRRRASWLIAAVVGTAFASPVVLESTRQAAQLGNNSLPVTTMVRQAVVNQWFLGDTPTGNGTTDGGRSLWAIAGVLLAAVGWILVIAAVARAVRRLDSPDVVLVGLPILLVPTIVAIGYSLAVSPLYNSRYFTFASGAMALVIGAGVRALPRPRLTTPIALVAIVALSLPIYISQRQVTGKSGTDWSTAASYVGARAHSGDGVYFSPLEANDDAVVKRSFRYVDTLYPEDFAGLVDVTLRTTGTQDGTLRGTSTQIGGPTAVSRLEKVDHLWVLRSAQYGSAASDADDAVLRTAGFSEVSELRGSRTDVLRFDRE